MLDCPLSGGGFFLTENKSHENKGGEKGGKKPKKLADKLFVQKIKS